MSDPSGHPITEEGGSSSSLLERYEKATLAVESDPQSAVHTLTELQLVVARQALFSSNESLDDIATSSLPLFKLEHDLAMAYTKLPTAGIQEIAIRGQNLKMACDLWTSFLQKLHAMEQLSNDEKAQYEDLLQLSDDNNSSNTNDDNNMDVFRPPPLPDREAKIARFRAKQQAENERNRLQAVQQRRGRMGMAATDELEGLDAEGLDRTLALTGIAIAKAEALEEWASTVRELPMIARMVQEQEQQQGDSRYGAAAGGSNSTGSQQDRRQKEAPRGPLKVTHVTQDSTTGQLQFRKEEIRSSVFRPGWNQPTMSLEELADKEVRGALEREARQKEAEAAAKDQPRRYDQLVKDGLEDNAELVDASAELDRKWDAFKDENPRGSGNKRGDVGDRNF